MKTLILLSTILLLTISSLNVGANEATESESDDLNVPKVFTQFCNPNHSVVDHENFCNCVTESSSLIGRPSIKIDCTLSDGVSNLTNEVFKAEKLPINTISLTLSYQRFSSIPLFSGNLKHLDMSNNLISIITENNFANIKELEQLDLSYNQISEVQFNAFTSLNLLHTLDLSNNQLVIVPANTFSPLPTLKTLKLSGNEGFGRIMGKNSTTSSLAKLYEQLGVTIWLRHLEMERCNISKISLINGRGLEVVNFGQNEIVDFTKLELPPNVLKLELSGNPIRDMKQYSLSHIYNLQELIIEDMPYLGRLEKDSLYGLSKLIRLSLEGSKNLSYFDPFIFKAEDEDQMGLKILNLRGCNLRGLNESLKDIVDGLDELHLEGNPFTCDCDLAWLKNVEVETEIHCNRPVDYQGKLFSEIEEKDLKCSKMSLFMKKLVNSLILLALLVGCSIAIWCFFRQLNPQNRRKQFQKVGPESPYQRVTIEPNRAEYSMQ